MSQLTKDDILSFLKKEKAFMKNEFGVVSIGLFGSYAKGIENAGSDIDLIVELMAPRFDKFAGLQIYLEKTFGKRVELIRKRENLAARFFKRIEKDILYV